MADNRTRETMTPAAPSPSWQRALYLPLIVLAWLAVLLVVGWLVTHVARTLLTLGLASIIAYALRPLVKWLDRRLPRGLAIAVAYLLGCGVVIALGTFLIVTAASQVTTLVGLLPAYAQRAQHVEPQLLALLRPFGVSAAAFHNAQHQ